MGCCVRAVFYSPDEMHVKAVVPTQIYFGNTSIIFPQFIINMYYTVAGNENKVVILLRVVMPPSDGFD